MDEYLYYSSVAQTVGVEVKFLTPEQVKEAWPMCDTSGLIGAIQHPDDGYIQPADLTQALAKGASSWRANTKKHYSIKYLAKRGRYVVCGD